MAAETTGRILLLASSHTYRVGAFLRAAAKLRIPVTLGIDGVLPGIGADPAAQLRLDLSLAPRAAAVAREFSVGHPIRAVVAAEDEGAQAAAAVAEALGLAAHPLAAVQTAQDKSAARRALWHAGLPTPPFALCSADDDPESVASRMPYPCVLKPNSLSASQGVMRADDERSFVDAWMRLRHLLRRSGMFPLGSPDSRRILVEGFLPGDEVAIEGLVTGGRFRTLAVFDKPDPLEGPFFEETIYVTPSRLSRRSQAAAIQAAAAAAAALGLVHGPVHAEVRVQGESATLVEIAPRSIGGLCSRALSFAGGRTLEEILLLHALGQETETLPRSPAASGVLMIPIPRSGILEGVGGVEKAREVPGIESVHMTIPHGARVEPPPEGNRYLGFVFARGRTAGQVEAALRRAQAQLEVRISPEPGRTAQTR